MAQVQTISTKYFEILPAAEEKHRTSGENNALFDDMDKETTNLHHANLKAIAQYF